MEKIVLALCHHDEIPEIDQVIGRETYFGFIVWLSAQLFVSLG